MALIAHEAQTPERLGDRALPAVLAHKQQHPRPARCVVDLALAGGGEERLALVQGHKGMNHDPLLIDEGTVYVAWVGLNIDLMQLADPQEHLPPGPALFLGRIGTEQQ
jgi:hypothetical protein